MNVGINMSLTARFDGNMNVIGKLLKEYRINMDLSYDKLSVKLENDLLKDVSKKFCIT